MDESREYWAFISYRHLDNKDAGREWATWLAREIETYEVPPELVGTKGSRGDIIPERIYPVFRDEDELSADSDLSSPIYEALRNSKTVIVVCSPRAVSSRYVGNEIVYFKSLGRGDRVLAMMIEGEPHSQDERECFPEALKHTVTEDGEMNLDSQVEPVAADFRLPNGGQGWHSPAESRKHFSDDRSATKYRERCDLAKLKLIAGILGVPLGKLIERDKAYQLALAKRKARIFTAVAAVMGVLAVLAVIGGIFAMVKRQEAADERDRAQRSETRALHQTKVALHARGTAENLISKMLFDLGSKLQNINQVELLDDVSRAAEKYFEDLPPDQVDAESERNRGVTLHSKAAILEAKGDLDGALAILRQALELSESLSQSNPNSFLAARDTIIGLREIGDLLTRQGKVAEATDYYQRSAEILIPTLAGTWDDSDALFAALFDEEGREESAAQLQAAAENDVAADLLKNMSALMERVGNTARNEGDLEKAMRKYDVSLRINEAVAEAYPENGPAKNNLHASYQKAGIVEQERQDYARAERFFRKALNLTRKEVERSPGDALWLERLANALERLAGNQVNRDQPELAWENAIEALGYRRSLVADDPVNLVLQHGLYVALTQSGIAADLTARREEATRFHSEANEIALKLAKADPSNMEWQALAAEVPPRASVGSPQNPSHLGTNSPGSVSRLPEVRAAAAKEPTNLEARGALVAALAAEAHSHESAGSFDTAREYLTEATRIAESIVSDLPASTFASRQIVAERYLSLAEFEIRRENFMDAADWKAKLLGIIRETMELDLEWPSSKPTEPELTSLETEIESLRSRQSKEKDDE